jgi:hypothetical protein
MSLKAKFKTFKNRFNQADKNRAFRGFKRVFEIQAFIEQKNRSYFEFSSQRVRVNLCKRD